MCARAAFGLRQQGERRGRCAPKFTVYFGKSCRSKDIGNITSGRRGRPYTIDDCLVIDLQLMMRRGWVRHGQIGSGSLAWKQHGYPVASIQYRYDLTDPHQAELRLSFEWALSSEDPHRVEQRIALMPTRPNYGGLRWWMLCPLTGQRAAKLYKPPGLKRFAGRGVWRLGYRSQRAPRRDQPFDRLYRVQRRLGAEEGWEATPFRPKGMWRRTFNRYFARYEALDELCAREVEKLEALMTPRQPVPPRRAAAKDGYASRSAVRLGC